MRMCLMLKTAAATFEAFMLAMARGERERGVKVEVSQHSKKSIA